MQNLISRATSHISSLINRLQVKRFLAVVLVGVILLTTNVDANQQVNKGLTKQIRKEAQKIDSVRPKTTNEWKQKTLLVSDLRISQKNQHKPLKSLERFTQTQLREPLVSYRMS